MKFKVGDLVSYRQNKLAKLTQGKITLGKLGLIVEVNPKSLSPYLVRWNSANNYGWYSGTYLFLEGGEGQEPS